MRGEGMRRPGTVWRVMAKEVGRASAFPAGTKWCAAVLLFMALLPFE